MVHVITLLWSCVGQRRIPTFFKWPQTSYIGLNSSNLVSHFLAKILLNPRDPLRCLSWFMFCSLVLAIHLIFMHEKVQFTHKQKVLGENIGDCFTVNTTHHIPNNNDAYMDKSSGKNQDGYIKPFSFQRNKRTKIKKDAHLTPVYLARLLKMDSDCIFDPWDYHWQMCYSNKMHVSPSFFSLPFDQRDLDGFTWSFSDITHDGF